MAFTTVLRTWNNLPLRCCPSLPKNLHSRDKPVYPASLRSFEYSTAGSDRISHIRPLRLTLLLLPRVRRDQAAKSSPPIVPVVLVNPELPQSGQQPSRQMARENLEDPGTGDGRKIHEERLSHGSDHRAAHAVLP